MTVIPGPAEIADRFPADRLERSAAVIGAIFYVAGSAAFVGIAVSFFMFRMYTLSNDSRIAFIVLFAGLFFALQGLIFILVARGGESRRHTSYVLAQISAMSAHAGAPPADPQSGE